MEYLSVGQSVDSVPDPQLSQGRINDGLANATYQFLCNPQSASACVDSDGKSTDTAKCGFGELNRKLSDGGHVGHNGGPGYAARATSRKALCYLYHRMPVLVITSNRVISGAVICECSRRPIDILIFPRLNFP
jgi:hypothetical protein